MAGKITRREHSGVSAMNKHLRKKFNGQFIVIWTIAIVALLGAMALCTDVAVIYYNYVKLQKAADTGALAGANYLVTLDPPAPTVTPAPGCTAAGGDAQDVACTYAAKNAGSNVDGSGPPVWTNATFVTPAPDAPAGLPAGTQTIEVTLTRDDIPAFFFRAVGRTAPFTVTVKAVAAIGPLGSVCPWPAGVSSLDQNGNQWTYGETVNLDESGVAGSGNWEWLNVPTSAPCNLGSPAGGCGSQLTSQITGAGCGACTLSTGNMLYTQPGNCTKNALDSLCPGGTCPTNPPLDVIVPMINWTGTTNGSSSQVQIVGFAVIQLTSFTWNGGKGTTLTGMFIKTIPAPGRGAPGPNPYPTYIVWLVK
jgi:Putative Flp pilus-assembly TadE/G-like